LQSRRLPEADQKLGELISEIRAQPEFENFFLPPTTDELMAAANPDPLIVVNLTSYRCDAFLIECNQTKVLELPSLTLERVQKRAKELRSSHLLDTFYGTSLLEWLWDVAARPVLDSLGFQEPISDANWPRV
jgi:hypothetical protein